MFIPLEDEEFDILYTELATFIATNSNPEDPLNRDREFHQRFKKVQEKYNKQTNLFVLDSKGNTLLHAASKNGNDLLIRFLISVGLDINRQNIQHETALYIACEGKHEGSVEQLLNLNADPNIGLNAGNKKPLYIAIDPEISDLSEVNKAKSVNIVKMLIKEGVDINERFGGFTAIHYAVINTRRLLVETIVKSGKADLHLLDSDGNSALHMLSPYRNEQEQETEQVKMQEEREIAGLLISHLDAINVQNKLGNTPLHRAVIYGNEHNVVLFLKKDYLFPQMKILSMQNNEGMTPLHEAVRSAKQGTKNLELLLRVATQDDLAVENIFRETALHVAKNAELRIKKSKIAIKEFLQWIDFIKNHKQGYLPIKKQGVELFRILRELRNVTERECQLFSAKINKLTDTAIQILAKAKLRQTMKLQSRFERLAGEIKNLVEEVDRHFHDYYDSAYFNDLKKAVKILEQSDYFEWKDQQLRSLTILPDLKTQDSNLYDIQDSVFDTAKFLYGEGLDFYNQRNFPEAKNKLNQAIEFYEVSAPNHIQLANAHWFLGLAQLNDVAVDVNYAKVLESIEESIRIYSSLNAYSSLEIPYQTLADIEIKKGNACFYEIAKKGILSSAGSTRMEKLAAHLALAGLYQTIRKQGLTLPSGLSPQVLVEHESFHYSEAYKLSQGELDDNAHVVLQREMGIAKKKAKLGTYNIQQCVAGIAHDPISGKTVLSHFDRFSGPLTFIDELLKEFPDTAKINLYLSGGRDRSNGRTVSDSNIDQVLKQIYAYHDRFIIKSTDLGDKPSPVAIVFDPVTAKLRASMPNRPDNSLDSRAAMMNLPLTKQGYLYPLDTIDFSTSEIARQVIYNPAQKQNLFDAYNWAINNPTGTEAWRHNQILFPLIRVNKATGSSINFKEALLTNFAPVIPNHAPPLQQPAQQVQVQNPDLIDLFALQSGQFPNLSPLDEISLDELLADLKMPSTSTCHRQRREADTNCLIPLDEEESLNLEKEHPKYKMDSSDLFELLNRLDETERSKLLQKLISNKVLVVGEKKTNVEMLTLAEQRRPHMERISTISRDLMNGVLLKDTLSDIIHGRFGNVAMNVGFLGSSYALGKLANLAVNTGEKLVAKGGSTLLGKALKVSGPIIGRASSVTLIVYDLNNQISALKEAIRNGDSDAKTDAIVNVVSDSIFIGVDLVEAGIEVAEIAGVIAGVSSVTGPVGEVVGAVVILGVQIYSAVRAVERLDHFVHLSNWEKFKEGWRAFLGMEPEEYLERMTDLVQAYDELLAQKLEFLQDQPDIKHYVFAALVEIISNCREIKVGNAPCRGITECNPGSIMRTVCDTEFPFRNTSTALFDRKTNDFQLAREKPTSPSGSELLCSPSGDYEVVSAEGAYRCDNAIGITDTVLNKTGEGFLFEFSGGVRTINGSLHAPNFFIFKNGKIAVYGGDQNDLFSLSGGSIKGELNGRKGNDTLDLSGFSLKKPIEIDFSQSTVNNEITISNIESFIGRELQPESVVVACSTQVLNTQGGTVENKDSISIPDGCDYALKALLHPNTEVVDHATKGNITYTILSGEGTITINQLGNVSEAEHRILFNDSLHNLEHIAIASDEANNPSEKIFRFHFLSHEIRRLLRNIEGITIEPDSKNGATLSYQLKPGASSSNRPKSLLNYLNENQYQQFLDANHLGSDSSNITLSGRNEIRPAIISLINRDFLRVKDYVVHVNSITLKSAFYFKEGIEFKFGKQNIYAIANINESNIDDIIKEYSPIAHRLNISFFISTSENEMITIGGGKQHQVLFTDGDATRNHMVGSAGENIFVFKFDLSSAHFPLNEVVLYPSNDDTHTDTIDFRLLLTQALTAFHQYPSKVKLIISRKNEHILLKLGLDSAKRRFYEIVTVCLREAAIYHWYKKLHVLLHVAPQQIVGPLSDLCLEPIPLEFDERHSLIVLGPNDVEENTVIRFNRKFDRYEFFRDGDNLIMTNALAFFLSEAERCQILLERFYKNAKLQTLSVKLPGQIIALNSTEIHTAADFNETQSMRDKVYYDFILNQTAPNRDDSFANGVQRHNENAEYASEISEHSNANNKNRQRRSIDTVVDDGKEQQIWDIADDYYDVLDSKKSNGHNKNNKSKKSVARQKVQYLVAANEPKKLTNNSLCNRQSTREHIARDNKINSMEDDHVVKPKASQVIFPQKLTTNKRTAYFASQKQVQTVGKHFAQPKKLYSLPLKADKTTAYLHSKAGSHSPQQRLPSQSLLPPLLRGSHSKQPAKSGIRQVTARGDTAGILYFGMLLVGPKSSFISPKRRQLAERSAKVERRINHNNTISPTR